MLNNVQYYNNTVQYSTGMVLTCFSSNIPPAGRERSEGVHHQLRVLLADMAHPQPVQEPDAVCIQNTEINAYCSNA